MLIAVVFLMGVLPFASHTLRLSDKIYWFLKLRLLNNAVLFAFAIEVARRFARQPV